MRGNIRDVTMGIALKCSPNANPYDRMVYDNRVKRPIAYVEQEINPALEIHRRRDVPLQTNVFAQNAHIAQSSYKPAVMENNGIAVIPNAGIFRKKQFYAIVQGG